MERDFKEKISSKMKAAIIISMLPNDLQDALIQQADRYEDYRVAKEKIISIVEAKLAMRSPDEMDVDTIGSGQYHTEWESLDAVGKVGIYCYRCGGQGHIAAKCGTPDPGKSKGKGGLGPQANPSKGKGKGKGGLVSQANPLKGKGKGDWKGFCSYCGKRGHTPRDCWTKQRDEESGKETLGAVDDFEHEVHNEEDITVGWLKLVGSRWLKLIGRLIGKLNHGAEYSGCHCSLSCRRYASLATSRL